MRIKKLLFLPMVVFILYAVPGLLFAHCQIPCGIYSDEMRFQMIEEDITTIEKSMQQIVELSGQSSINFNQLVRWITNKDEHAQKIQDVVNAYFLTQRIKPVDETDKQAYEEYAHKLALLHQMLFYAMKAKQTTDPDNVTKLRALLSEFHDAYFGPEEKEHLKEHH